jgi:2-(1,2-epoxy-1,2-dihydrophenyl)acetyl-CoA isomerase
MTSEVLFEMRGAVLVVTFNRPDKGNALTWNMAKLLSEKLKAVSNDRGLRAVLLRGQGDQFMVGHEIDAYTGSANAVQEQIFQKIQFFYTVIRELQAMDRPVIAAVDGTVSGAGFNLMLASDIVIAARRAVFNTGFTPYAMVPDAGASFFLPRKVGAARALELLLLSEDFSAETAEKWGLVNRVVEDTAAHSEALIWAEKLAEGPTRIFGSTKKLVAKAFEQDLNAQLSLESAFFTAGSKTFDFREAMNAHVGKRAARFTGS